MPGKKSRKPKREHDFNVRAFEVVQQATSEKEEPAEKKEPKRAEGRAA